jgi:ArsR family transcriptional regulator, arsenate/arsenite/antimonite-responsive transcriptional repressor
MNKVTILKSFADETRLKILRKLATKNEVSCQEFQSLFKLSQPTLSHHFHKLIEAKLIISRKDGTSYYYSLNKKVFLSLGINIHQFLSL